jgi:glycosyltransferase involved in cell wall biosynthesis
MPREGHSLTTRWGSRSAGPACTNGRYPAPSPECIAASLSCTPDQPCTLVYFGDQWDHFWRRRQQIAWRLANHEGVSRVVYIELPITLATLGRYAARQASPVVEAQCQRVLAHGPVKRVDKCWIVTPIAPLPGRNQWERVTSLNRVFLVPQLLLVLRALVPRGRPGDTILWISLPHLYLFYGDQFSRAVDFSVSCYDCSEAVEALGPCRTLDSAALARVRQRDEALSRAADVVIVNSEVLLQEKRALNLNTYLVPNGVDCDLFVPAPPAEYQCPEPLRSLHGPILGYVGSVLAPWVDFELVEYLAHDHPEWQIVLVGPTDARGEALSRQPNVHCLGSKPYADLPSYLAHFDVCLNLYKPNQCNESRTSLKLPMYLAMGRPVVSTDTAGVGLFPGLVSVARTHSDFASLVQLALACDAPGTPHRGISAARSWSWDTRVERIIELLGVNPQASSVSSPAPEAPTCGF